VGKTHDKKFADTEGITYPPEAILYKDTGFQGYNPAGKETRQAKKKPLRGELTAAEKRTNRKLAHIRVRVKHALSGVKRCRIVKDVLRNTKEGVSDEAMEAACGLHNLRVQKSRAAAEKVTGFLIPDNVYPSAFQCLPTHSLRDREAGVPIGCEVRAARRGHSAREE
jgi:DDE superfamily endonuclease